MCLVQYTLLRMHNSFGQVRIYYDAKKQSISPDPYIIITRIRVGRYSPPPLR